MGAKNSKRPRSQPPRTLGIDAAWLFAAVPVAPAALATYLLWQQDWARALLMVGAWVFRLWLVRAARIFVPWAYHLRRARAHSRHSHWDKANDHLRRAQQTAG